MKKIISALIVCVISISSLVISASAMPMYAPDGRTIEVAENEVHAWENVGWYAYPVVTMYYPDGRSILVAKADEGYWSGAGWYTYPVDIIYAPDGRSIVVKTADVQQWVNVGWYTAPVTTLYSVDGRSAVVYSHEVDSWKKVGWFTYAEVYENYKNEYAYILKQKMKEDGSGEYTSFSLVYINSDVIPELVYRRDEYHAIGAEVYTYTGNRVVCLGVYGEFGDILYQPKNNRFTGQYWGMGCETINVYCINGENAVMLCSLFNNENIGIAGEPKLYSVNNVNVSRSEYMRYRKSYGLTGDIYTSYGYAHAADTNKYKLTNYNINRLFS